MLLFGSCGSNIFRAPGMGEAGPRAQTSGQGGVCTVGTHSSSLKQRPVTWAWGGGGGRGRACVSPMCVQGTGCLPTWLGTPWDLAH